MASKVNQVNSRTFLSEPDIRKTLQSGVSNSKASLSDTKMIGNLMDQLKKEHQNINLKHLVPLPNGNQNLYTDRSKELKHFEDLGFAI